MKKFTKSAFFLMALAAGVLASCSDNDDPVNPVPEPEPEPFIPTLEVVATTPVEGGVWEKSSPWVSNLNIQFEVTFAEEVSLLSETPEGIVLVRDDGEAVSEGTWHVSISEDFPATIILALRDESGFLCTTKPADHAYTLTIPAGIILSAADETLKNGEIVMSFFDSAKVQQEATIAKIESTSPADMEVLPANGAITLNFRDEVEVVEAAPAVKVEKTDGTAVSATWVAAKGADAKTIVLTPSGFAIEDATYVITIPAGLAKDVKGNLSVETVVKVYGTAAAQEAAQIKVVSADDIVVTDGKAASTFKVTLNHEVKKKNSYPAFRIFKNADKTGDALGAGGGYDYSWSYAVDGAVITPGYTHWSTKEGFLFDAEVGAKYYLVIPAGTVQTSDGVLNDELVVELNAVAAE